MAIYMSMCKWLKWHLYLIQGKFNPLERQSGIRGGAHFKTRKQFGGGGGGGEKKPHQNMK